MDIKSYKIGTTLTKREELNHIYRLYKDLILDLDEPFYDGAKILNERVGRMNIGLHKDGIGNQISPEKEKILIEGYAYFSLQAINIYGKEIYKHLKGEVKERFLKFYKVFSEYELKSPNSSDIPEEDTEKIREVKAKLIREFRKELINQGLNLGTLKRYETKNRFGEV